MEEANLGGGLIKRILKWIGIGVEILVVFAGKNAFAVSDQAFSMAVLAVMLAVIAFHFSQRLDALDERVIHKDYKGIKKAIGEGEGMFRSTSSRNQSQKTG